MQKVDDLDVQDITWFRPDGKEMTEDEWNAGWVRCLGVRLSGRTLNDINDAGELLKDDTFLMCFNPHHESIAFYLPECTKACNWELLVDTKDAAPCEAKPVRTDEPYELIAHSAVVFRESVAKTPIQTVTERPVVMELVG